jgi:hypothetical protein
MPSPARRKDTPTVAVQARGCEALTHLVVNHSFRKTAAVRVGAIDLAEAARARFAAEEVFAQCICG